MGTSLTVRTRKPRVKASVASTKPSSASAGVMVAPAEGGPEGVSRGPFFGYGELGGLYPFDPLGDGWQSNLQLGPFALRAIPVIEAIRNLYRSAFAQLNPHHYEMAISPSKGKQISDRIDTTPIRTMMFPNSYETGAEFFARVGDEWVFHGEVLIWGIRNSRTEIAELHIVPWKTWMPMIDYETKEVFYLVSQSSDLLTPSEATMMIPARDVMHLRWATPRHPLIGEGPFAAAGLAAGILVALTQSQMAFFKNQRRPSGILSTDQPLNRSQMTELRAAFDAQSKDINVGGVPILAYGLKFNQMGINPEDAKVIETLRMGNEEIARCAGVPPALIGDVQQHSFQGSTAETLIQWWLAISLGGLIERFECSFNRIFQFNGLTSWVDLDTNELLRMELGKRMDALGKGVQNGIITPNEARDRSLENLSAMDGGDGGFMQRQMTPVALLGDLAAAELKKAQAPPPAPAPPPGDTGAPAPAPAPADGGASDAGDTGGKDIGDADIARALSVDLIQRAKEAS